VGRLFIIILAAGLAFTWPPRGVLSVVGPKNKVLIEPRLQQLVGRWFVLSSTFGGPPDSTSPTLIIAPVALGRAVYSVWKQGTGANTYEANALWAHDSTTRQVRVFEANSVGVAETHLGAFDQTGALVLELRSPGNNDLIQRRVFRRAGDTLRMTARFVSGGRVTDHAVAFLRR
jgi:hypothetical protein